LYVFAGIIDDCTDFKISAERYKYLFIWCNQKDTELSHVQRQAGYNWIKQFPPHFLSKLLLSISNLSKEDARNKF